MSEKNDTITKFYSCKYCGETHKVTIGKDMLENQPKYPFPYVFLHDSIRGGDPIELLTILYFDKEGQIRGQEIQEFSSDKLFSKEQVVSMMEPLMEEVQILRKENLRLKQRLNDLTNK